MEEDLRSTQRYTPDDIYIAIMGVTGAGKSTFIEKCCEDGTVTIGHGLKSETKEVAIYTLKQAGMNIHLIDTPGFDDTYRTDSDVLQDLAYWLTKSYRDWNIKLTGLVYLHRITDPRMTGNALKNLRTFQKLCGKPSMSSVVLVTTRWEEVRSEDGEVRELDLRTTPEFWGDMMREGSTLMRHDNTELSALKILNYLIRQRTTTKLEIQREMVELNRSLFETEAGREVEGELRKQREAFEKRLDRAQNEMKEALEANDSKHAAEIAKEQDRLQEMIRRSERGREDLRITMERLIQEKDAQHQRIMQDLRKEQENLRYEKEQAERQRRQAEEDRRRAESQKQASYSYTPAPVVYRSSCHDYHTHHCADGAAVVGGAAIGGAALVGGLAVAAMCNVM